MFHLPELRICLVGATLSQNESSGAELPLPMIPQKIPSRKQPRITCANFESSNAFAPKTPIHTGMPTSEYQQEWKGAQEKTSAGPSTLTFGHCKAGALDPRIIEFEAAMASIPMRSGYAYKRWQKGTDIELLKRANSFHVSKLRTSLLLRQTSILPTKSSGGKWGSELKRTTGWPKNRAEVVRITGQSNLVSTSASPWINCAFLSGQECYALTT
jgi:hypothetical protein